MATDSGKPAAASTATPHTATPWSKCMTYLRRLWTDVSNDLRDADVQAAETLVHDIRQRHGDAADASAEPGPPDTRPAPAVPPQYRSTPDPSFGSRSLAQRRERERLQRELIEAEAMAAHASTARRPEAVSQPPRTPGQPLPGKAPEKLANPGRADA